MRATKFTFSVILTVLFISGCRDNEVQVADELIDSYRNSCVSSGRWSSTAIANSRALSNVFKQLMELDSCKSSTSYISAINESFFNLQNLLDKNSSFSRFREQEEMLQDTLLALNSPNLDENVLEALKQNLIQTQVLLMQAKSRDIAFKESSRRNQLAHSTQALSDAITNILNNSQVINQCLSQSPAAAISLSTKLAAIGGSFFSPMFGALGSTLGNFINFGINYARQAPLRDALWNTYKSRIPQALTCGLESMTEFYCQAVDSMNLLGFQNKNYEPDGKPKQKWLGLDILSKRMTVITSWLLDLQNGVEPSDEDIAKKQNKVWDKIFDLDKTNRTIKGRLNETLRLITAAGGDVSLQKRYIKNYIVSTACLLNFDRSCTGGTSGVRAFMDFSAITHNHICWLSLGYTENRICPDPRVNGTLLSHEAYADLLISQVSASSLEPNWTSLWGAVKGFVDIEFITTINPDSKSLLSDAVRNSPDNLSPLGILELIAEFLKNMIIHHKLDLKEHQGKNVADTLEFICASIKAITNRTPNNCKINVGGLGHLVFGVSSNNSTGGLGKADPDLVKIKELFELFRLRLGLQFFFQRLENVIESDLQFRLEKGEYKGEIEDIIRTAGLSIKDRLTNSGVINVDAIEFDISDALATTQMSLETFNNFFTPLSNKTLQHLFEKSKDEASFEEVMASIKDPKRKRPIRPFGSMLAKLCLQLLGSNNGWSSELNWDYCKSAFIISSNYKNEGDPNLVLKMDKLRSFFLNEEKKYRSQNRAYPKERRMCAFHRFMRASRIAELITHRKRNPDFATDSDGNIYKLLNYYNSPILSDELNFDSLIY